MAQFYSDPTREADKWSLPDAEVFYIKPSDQWRDHELELLEAGWYFWFCFPGCMPDSEPSGPYPTEAKAVAAAREQASD